MKLIGKCLIAIYEICIVYPILFVATAFTALFTIVFVHWKNAEFVHVVQQVWSRLFFYLTFCNVEVEGLENLQKGQSYVFVCNHESYFDVWAVYGWLPVIFKWIMKAELRKVPFIGSGCAAAGHIFIERGATKQALRSLQRAKETLVDGVSVVIYPEGTRSEDGKVASFKRGAFMIAYQMELPVVPLSLSGCRECLPKGAWLVRPFHTVTLRIGKPIDLREYNNRERRDEGVEVVRQAVINGKNNKE